LKEFRFFKISHVCINNVKIKIKSHTNYMISSLDGNDVFSISRMYQQKYQDELKDYIEVTPPLLLNIAGVTVQTGSSSFKEFMILFDKIYLGTYAMVSKKRIDPNAKKSNQQREIAIAKFDKSFSLASVRFQEIKKAIFTSIKGIVIVKELLKFNWKMII